MGGKDAEVVGLEEQGPPPPKPKPSTVGPELDGKGGLRAAFSSKQGLAGIFLVVAVVSVGAGVGASLGSSQGSSSIAASPTVPSTSPTSAPTTPAEAPITPTIAPTTPTLTPTSSPETRISASVVISPVFDVNKENVAETACYTSGCDGSFEWVDLDQAKNYELAVRIKGDYGSDKENVRLRVGTTIYPKSGETDCGSYTEVFRETLSPDTDRKISLMYDNTQYVSPECGSVPNKYASKLEATLKEV